MSLVEIWTTSRDQLEDKQVQQIISFAGEGDLRDGSQASLEFRDFLYHVPSSFLSKYMSQCITSSFGGSGFALQDIVNQIGRRLGFDVTDGRYRGRSELVGFDGIWRYPEGHALVVEVKTTDAYRIKLDSIAGYRKKLVSKGEIVEEKSSILIVVGRDDTGGLEAQIRGSRHAWDVRLISLDALIGLLKLKEEVEETETIQRIYALLIPREFTKLDEIIDIVFTATEEVRPEDIVEEEDKDESPTIKPMAFNEACISRIEKYLEKSFIKRSRTTYSTADQTISVICAVSKTYFRGGRNTYWFAFHSHQKEFLEGASTGYVAFGCGDEENIILIPFDEYKNLLDGMHTTVKSNRLYWHVNISQDNNDFNLNRKKGENRISLDAYLLK